MQSPTLLIGLSGPIAAGKTKIAQELHERYHFVTLRSSNTLARMLTERGLDITEANMQNIGKEMIDSIGGAGLSALVLADYDPNQDHVYDSIRHVADLAYFVERFGVQFRLLFIDAPDELRQTRYLERTGRDTSAQSYARRAAHPVEQDVPGLREAAAAVVTNVDIERSMETIDKLISQWRLDAASELR